jgi:hypothetical protein
VALDYSECDQAISELKAPQPWGLFSTPTMPLLPGGGTVGDTVSQLNVKKASLEDYGLFAQLAIGGC